VLQDDLPRFAEAGRHLEQFGQILRGQPAGRRFARSGDGWQGCAASLAAGSGGACLAVERNTGQRLAETERIARALDQTDSGTFVPRKKRRNQTIGFGLFRAAPLRSRLSLNLLHDGADTSHACLE
jgi:hypothetical protein